MCILSGNALEEINSNSAVYLFSFPFLPDIIKVLMRFIFHNVKINEGSLLCRMIFQSHTFGAMYSPPVKETA